MVKSIRALCKACGWGKEVYLASKKIDPQEEEKQSHILLKLKKLFALSSSDNAFEAELATVKANQLLLKHQIQYSELDSDEFFVERILQGKRIQGKHYAISSILSEFKLMPVFNQGKGNFWLEVSGSKEEIEIGQYMVKFFRLSFRVFVERSAEKARV